tara:strand:- start:3028 stop:3936 length:909 start_codon:yes stop_codon:yes gene_type:complete
MDFKFLDNFLLQTTTTNLKTKGLYPNEIEDLSVKVSFGMGAPTHVPWITFCGPGMSTSDGYYPSFLYFKKQNILILSFGISETVPQDVSWNSDVHDNSQKISEFLEGAFRYKDSYVYKHYTPKIAGDSVSYEVDGIEVDHSEIEKDLRSIFEIYKKCLDIEIKTENSSISKGLFYLEKQLEDFIIENWDNTQFGIKYDLIIEEGVCVSQQYRTGIGPIDILAKEKETGDYVVIELKKNQTSDDTIGQVARYMGWIKDTFKSNVKGIIVAGKYDEKLYYANKIVPNVELFLYEVDFRLTEYSR